MPPIVDQKYAHNQALQSSYDARREALREQLRAISYSDEAGRAAIEAQIDQLGEELENSLYDIETKEWGQNVSVRSSDEIQQIAYGYCRVGGLVTFLTADEGEAGRYLHCFVTICGHKTSQLKKLYFDGEQVTFTDLYFGTSNGEWENLVFASPSHGADDQAANSDLVSQSNLHFPGKWTEVHRQRGHTGIYIIMLYDATKFANGFPEIALEGDMKTDIYDPRTDSFGYTNNAALVIADYLTNQHFGAQYTIDQIDLDSLSAAADICDEEITLADETTEPRYTINGAFRASSGYSHAQVLSDMCRAMAGEISFIEGKWHFFPGKWVEPTITLSEDDLRSEMRIAVRPPGGELFNTVKGLYRGEQTLWEFTEYPLVRNELYRTEDGLEIQKEVDFPFTTSASACQRIGKLILERARQWTKISARFGVRALALKAGDNVYLTNERLGYASKPFRIVSLKTIDGPSVEVQLELRETSSAVYDWNDGEETTVDLAPNTVLPSPNQIIKPSGLTLESGTEHLDIRADGTVFSRIRLDWNASNDPFVLSGGLHQIQYKKSSEATWRNLGFVGGVETHAYILDIKDGELYDARVRAWTSLAASEWETVTGHFALGKQEKPSTPTSFTATATEKGIEFSWEPITDLDVSAYEIRVGDNFSTGDRVVLTSATSAFWSFQEAGTYTFHLRAIDTSKIYSNSITQIITINAPTKPQNLTPLVVYNMVRLTWNAPMATSFPVKEYKLYVGETFGGSVLFASTAGTLISFNEQTAGTYTYYVTAVDQYGNESEPATVTVDVDSAPLFVLLYDQTLNPASASTLTNAIVEDGDVIAPVVTGRTYSEHFTDNSWTTPQDQIDAGFPLYIQPSNASNGIYEQIIDYGEVLDGALITLQDTGSWADGDGTVTRTISYSNDGVSYTDGAGSQVFGTNFRYVKIKYEFDGDDTTSVYRLSAPRVRLSVKTEARNVSVSAVSTDGSGTLVTLDADVLDIIESSISVSPVGSSPLIPGYTISGNEIRVFLWDTSGTRANGTVTVRFDAVVSSS